MNTKMNDGNLLFFCRMIASVRAWLSFCVEPDDYET